VIHGVGAAPRDEIDVSGPRESAGRYRANHDQRIANHHPGGAEGAWCASPGAASRALVLAVAITRDGARVPFGEDKNAAPETTALH
jgi:hypothetical protein